MRLKATKRNSPSDAGNMEIDNLDTVSGDGRRYSLLEAGEPILELFAS